MEGIRIVMLPIIRTADESNENTRSVGAFVLTRQSLSPYFSRIIFLTSVNPEEVVRR